MSQLIGRSLLNLLASVASMASGFLVAVMIARLLGPAGVGATAFAIWLTAVAAAVVDRGWPQTVLRFGTLADAQERHATILGMRRHWRRGLLVISVVLFCGAAVSLTVLPPEALIEPSLIVLICAAYSVSGFAASSRRAFGDFMSPARRSILGSLLYVPGSLLGALLAGPLGAVAALLFRSLPILPLIRLPSRSNAQDRQIPVGPSPEARSYAGQVWISDLLDILVLSRVEYLFLSLLASTTDLGFFAVAIAFAGLVEQLSLQLSAPLVVSFASAATHQPPGAESGHLPSSLQLPYERAAIGLSITCLPICIGGAAIMPLLLPLVYGEAYAGLVPMAAVLLLSSALSALSILPWSALSALGHAKTITRCVLVLAGMTIVLLPAAIAVWGLWGAVAAKCLIQLVGFLLFQARLEHLGGPKLPYSSLLRVASAAAASALAAVLLLQALADSRELALAGSILFAAAIYPLALRITGAVPAAHFSSLVSGPAVSGAPYARLRRILNRLVAFTLR